ncbi:glutamate-rich protein 1 [Heptranchias perlo]|uniref:glutamate-rich protein 1 n=1 Tax=Heptranchias perlo TaxID=212740 RepID=UPI00355A88A1
MVDRKQGSPRLSNEERKEICSDAANLSQKKTAETTLSKPVSSCRDNRPGNGWTKSPARIAFKQKVLKKLYSSPPLEEKIHEAPTKNSRAKLEQREVERNKINGDAVDDAQIIPVCRKVYTVSLPPSGYEVCSTRPNEQLESQDSSDEEPDGGDSSPKFQRKRRRRRKFNSSLLEHISKNAQSALQQPEALQTDILQTLQIDSTKLGPETLTKNRRRKLKKKRHKEKLKAAGLVSRATAVEFTYQPGEGSSEEDAAECEKKAAEVIDSLQAI